MWPFRRKVEAPAAEGPRPVPAPVIRRDWAGLQPIQRFVGAHPLTAPSDQFSDDLATHQDPSVTTDTMGHQVSAEAPPGLVLALARPTTRSDGPAMIPRPRVQRRVAGAVTESGEWDGDEAASDPARPTPLPRSAHAVAARELAVVAPEPAIQRLTSLEPGADPAPLAPVAQRSRAVATPIAPSMPAESHGSFELPPVTAQRLTLGQSRRLGLGPPIKQVPHPALPSIDTPAETRDPLGTTTPGHVSMDMLPAQRTATDVPTHRVPTDAPVVQRLPADVPVPARVPLDLAPAPKASMDLGMGVRQVRSSTPATPPAQDAGDSARRDLALARTSAGEAAADNQAVAPLSATSSPAPAFAFSPELPPVVQRRADEPTPPSSESHPTATLPLAPPPAAPAVSASRWPRATDSPAGRPMVLRSVWDSAMAPLVGSQPLRPTATLQRSASANGTIRADPSPQGMELPLMSESEVTHLPDQPSQGARDVFDTPQQEGKALPLAMPSFLQRASEDAPTLVLPRRDHDPSLTLPSRAREIGPAVAESPSSGLPLAPSQPITLQRASDDTPLPDPGAQAETEVVQGVWYENRVPVSRVGEGALAPESIGPAAAAVPSHGSESEMDELAGKLYDRIRSRLKSELLVDRERAGFLTDLR